MKNILSTIVIIFIMVNFSSKAQDITNTLAPNGSFKIKDSATDYFILNQSNGTISLISPLAGNQRGSIFKGNSRFVHTYNGSGTTGYNTFIGIEAGNFTMGGSNAFEGSYNTGVGYQSLSSLTTGRNNSAFGRQSLFLNTTGISNSAFGNSSLLTNTTGNNNSAFGASSLYNNTTGYENSAFGSGSLLFNLTGYYNSAFGSSSLSTNFTGNSNSAFGSSSLSTNWNGNSNSAFGFEALYANTSGNYNSAFGSSSLYSNTNGNNNSAFGTASLYSNQDGYFNSAIGYFALYGNTNGYSNSAIGSFSLRTNSTGINNAAFGVYSLYNNNANENSAFGSNSLYSNTTGVYNTAVGFNALFDNTTGWNNTAVGHHSLENNTGNYNTAIGYNAGSSVTTGENLTLIGIDSNPSAPTAIDQITLGNQFVSSLRCNVQTITSLSDARDKKNIQDLTLGLDFITKLKPRQFNWDRREWYEEGISDGSKTQEEPTAGFIAQEFDEVQKTEHAEWLNLVLKDNPEKWEATPGNLFPIVVKAIQELKIENEELKERLSKYEAIQSTLVKKLEQMEFVAQAPKVQIVNSENNNQ